jgi:Protein of unknown function (DUF2652)
MRLHRMNLAHSQDVTRRLLEAILDAVPMLGLVEIEGDAAFLAMSHDEDTSALEVAPTLALTMHRAFHTRQEWMVARNMCACDACKQIGQLKVKFVMHDGEVASQTIRNRSKLVGIEVIAAHRMLKNAVPVPEYVLMSRPVFEHCHLAIRERAVALEQDLEGVGTRTLYFVDLDEIALERPPQDPMPSLPSRVRETVGVGLRCFPRVVGVRRLHPRLDAEEIASAGEQFAESASKRRD